MLNKTIHNNFSNYVSLDEYLLSIGVPPSKIANSKKDKVKKLGRNDAFDLCYDFIREEKEDIKVPIKYIYDVARDGVTRHNMSWYDHMNFALFGGNSQFKNGLISNKLRYILNLYNGYTNDELKDTFQDGDDYLSVHTFSAYERPNQPTFYYQMGDGTHRLAIAKVMGIDYLYGRLNFVYRLNENKEYYFTKINKLLEELDTLIDKLPLFDYYRYSNYITFNSTFIFDTHDSSFNWILSLKNEEYTELDVFINNLSFATKVLKELTESVDFNNNKYEGYSKLHLFFKRYSRRFSNVYILHDFYENKAFFIDFMLFNIAYTEKINK